MGKSPLWLSIHEAGHAVAKLANQPGPYVEGISIVEQPDGQLGEVLGCARFSPSSDMIVPSYGTKEQLDALHANRIRRAQQDIIDHLAGPVAETRWRLRQRAGTQVQGIIYSRTAFWEESYELPAGDDFDRVGIRMRWLAPSDMEQAFIDAWLGTETLVAAHWKRIVELGRWLQSAGQIEGGALYDWWEGQSAV